MRSGLFRDLRVFTELILCTGALSYWSRFGPKFVPNVGEHPDIGVMIRCPKTILPRKDSGQDRINCTS